MESPEPEIEFLETASDGEAESSTGTSAGSRLAGLGLLLVTAALIGWLAFADGGGAPLGGADEDAEDAEADASPPSGVHNGDDVGSAVPRSLLAAERFAADPSGPTLRALFAEVGGFGGLELATAEGAFDLVRFDPANPDRLFASRRSSYGDARNNDVNEVWTVGSNGSITQRVWAPDRDHDFVHFNADGTATMWVHGGGDGFAPRRAVLMDAALNEIRTSEALYASRFSVTNNTLFALTGDGDYYSNAPGHVSLVADDENGLVILAEGAGFAWIDSPTSEILVAYPGSDGGSSVVWDVETLKRLPSHPLAGQEIIRAAVSGDGTSAVMIRVDGRLEAIDMTTGRSKTTFGLVDGHGVDQAITVNRDGTVAVTVERTGRVTIWWVGDDRPVAAIDADAGQPRWVPERYSPVAASAVSADGQRVALRVPATSSTATSYLIIDTSIGSWVERACEAGRRPLTDAEAIALGISADRLACPGRR